jgi:hypothetical protein
MRKEYPVVQCTTTDEDDEDSELHQPKERGEDKLVGGVGGRAGRNVEWTHWITYATSSFHAIHY